MKGLNRLTIAVVASSLLAVPAVYAAPASVSSPVHAMFAKSKTSTVKLSLRNDSGSPMEVKVGDKVMTLEPGKPVSLSLEVGTRIVANSATPNHEVGSLIEEVVKDHAGATIIIRSLLVRMNLTIHSSYSSRPIVCIKPRSAFVSLPLHMHLCGA